MGFVRKNLKLIVFCLIVAAVVIADSRYGWSHYIKNTENLKYISDMIESNYTEAVLLYMVVTVAACVLLAVPGVTFAVIAALLFGPWMGTVFCLIATTLGAIAAYLAGRFFLKDSIKPVVMKNKWLRKVLFDEAGKNDMTVLMITRLVPLFPYNLQNFAYGITDIGIIPYSIYTFTFMLPGVAVFTFGSAGIMNSSGRMLYLGIAGVLLAVLLPAVFLIRKKYSIKEEE